MQLRVRKHSGRLIGPIEISEFYKLYASGLIHDLDQCQVYPDGNWRKVVDYKDSDKKEENKNDSIFSKIRKSHEIIEEPIKEDIQVMDISKLKSKSIENNTDIIKNKTDIIEIKPEKIPDEIDRTIVAKKIEDVDTDKTLVNVDTAKYLEELKKQKLVEERERAIAERVAAIENEKKSQEENLTTDSTSVINLKELHAELKENVDLDQVERELEREAQISEEEREIALSELDEDDDDEYEVEYDYEDGEFVYEDELEEEDLLKAKKRKKRIIMVIIVALLYLILADEEGAKNETKKIVDVNPINPSIEYPIENEVPNIEKSQKALTEGMALYNTYTYSSLLKAAGKFTKSLENKRENNESLYPFIITLSSLLENSVQPNKDANTVFKLLRLVRTKVYLKQDVAIAYALFYRNIGKYSAALNVLKKYDKVRNSLETGKENYKDLFFYLISDLYLKLGKTKEIDEFYKIYTPNIKTRANLLAPFIEFDLERKRTDLAEKLINSGLKINPDDVTILLFHAELNLIKNNYKLVREILDKVKLFNVGDSRVLYDKYLLLSGLQYYYSQQFKEANDELRKVFRQNNKIKYRKIIAELNPAGAGIDFETLVKESKAEIHIAQTEEAIEDLDWSKALTHAISATDQLDNYLPAKINLAKVQINQGFFKKALDLLQQYSKEYPDDKRVVFNLIDAYIESYKHYNAKQVLLNAANGKLRSDPQYDKLSAKLNIRLGDKLQAVRWLQEAINSNPIDDENYYQLARLLIKLNKHKTARAIISSAIDLAPDKVEYRIANAEIIYEQNDPDTAIGYLRQQMDEFPNAPELEGEIAIYYYKSGQIKNFEESIKTLEKKFTRADKLYNFLIQSSALDHRANDVVKYSMQLIKVKPGDLKTRMLLVETLINLKRFDEALKFLGSIEERLPDYPKLLYYKSTIELARGNPAGAKELAMQEVKKNPGLVDGHILLGNILKTEGDYFKAEEHFKEAQKLMPNSAIAIAGMAYINFKKHQLESAIDLYNKSINLDSENAILRKELGDVYRQNGQNIDAVTQYKIYLELEPDTQYKGEIETYIRQFK